MKNTYDDFVRIEISTPGLWLKVLKEIAVRQEYSTPLDPDAIATIAEDLVLFSLFQYYLDSSIAVEKYVRLSPKINWLKKNKLMKKGI